MANTYTLIASNTLSSSAASVTFSAIPNTYTDLVLRVSARSTVTATQDTFAIQFNGSSATNYSWTYIEGNGSSASSSRWTSAARINVTITGDTATSNTFTNAEMYLPNYLVNQNKPSSTFSVNENNSAGAEMQVTANLWRVTSAITEINLVNTYSGYQFKAGSSFFLYGIKNS